MDSIVKIKNKKTGAIKELVFPHAQGLLQINSDFEPADKTYEFINNELIKRPSNKGSKKPKKSKPDSEGAELPK